MGVGGIYRGRGGKRLREVVVGDEGEGITWIGTGIWDLGLGVVWVGK